MKIALSQLIERGETLYGKNRVDWKFTCPNCQHTQTGQTVYSKVKSKEPTKRYGILQDKVRYNPESECYEANCDWVAYGLFNSNILIIIDPTKPHNENTKENCFYIFPLADDQEMLKAAGVQK